MNRFTAYDASTQANTDWIVDDNKLDEICYGNGSASKLDCRLRAFVLNCLHLGFRANGYHW